MNKKPTQKLMQIQFHISISDTFQLASLNMVVISKTTTISLAIATRNNYTVIIVMGFEMHASTV